jgi:hypothetical protein
MRKSVVIGVLVAALLALAAWRLLLEATEDPPARAGASPAAGPSADARSPEPGPDAAPSSRRVEAIRPATFAEPEAVAATDPDLLRVLVVDDGTGVPVPGAEVAWTDARFESQTWSAPFGRRRGLIADFDAAPHRAWADYRGIARIRASQELAVAARLGDRFGYRWFDTPPRGEIRLELVRGPFIAAKVVTDDGSPVPGVMVWFSVSYESGKMGMLTAVSRSPDGVAIADHPATKVKDSYYGSCGPIEEATASIMGLAKPQHVKASLADLERGPITLVLERAAPLDVQVLDPDGRPLLASVRLSLTARGSGGASVLRATATSGVASFPAVPTGVRLELRGETAAFDSATRSLDPLVPGDAKKVELRLARKRAQLKGRAVDEFRIALARRTIEIDVITSSGLVIFPETVKALANERGDFSFTVDRESHEIVGSAIVFEVRGVGGVLERGRVGRVSRQIFDADELDLGELALVPPTTLVTGIVKDELGMPLSGAVVKSSATSVTHGQGTVSIGGGRQPPWPGSGCATTGDDGAFQIPAPTRSDGYVQGLSVTAQKPGYVDAREYLSRGDKTVTIVMKGAGTLAGRLVLPELASVSKLSMRVTRATQAESDSIEAKVFEDCIDSTGAFRLEGLLPGVMSLEVLMHGVEEPLTTVSDIQVVRCRDAVDARLRAIDLRGHEALRR